jgi:hypothetical protein
MANRNVSATRPYPNRDCVGEGLLSNPVKHLLSRRMVHEEPVSAISDNYKVSPESRDNATRNSTEFPILSHELYESSEASKMRSLDLLSIWRGKLATTFMSDTEEGQLARCWSSAASQSPCLRRAVKPLTFFCD